MLDLFAYWTQVRRSNDEQSRAGGGEGNDLWFNRSLTDLHDDLYGAFGRAAIRTGLQLLIDKGLADSRTNPSKPWDRTLQYRTLHGAKSDDVQGAESDDDAGARPSQPSAAQAETEGETEKKTARPKPITYEGRRVDPVVVDDARALLDLFNAEADRRLSALKASGQPSDHLRQIIGALLSNPGATLDEWRQGVCRVVADPPSWTDGRTLGLGDVFGPRAAARTLAPPPVGMARVNGYAPQRTDGRMSTGQILNMLEARKAAPNHLRLAEGSA